MRNMSFFHTQGQFRDRTKTETTRKGEEISRMCSNGDIIPEWCPLEEVKE